MQEVMEFIQRRFPKDSNWTNGNCYYFALILSDRFNGTITGYSAVWSARLIWVQEVIGSNPVTPTIDSGSANT